MVNDELAQRLGVQLPEDYRAYRDRGGGHLPPWKFLNDADVPGIRDSIVSHYPRYAAYMPFAYSLASDDVALFTPEGKVCEVHMFTESGWESGGEVESFREWLRLTMEEVIYHLELAAKRKRGGI